MFHPNFEPYFVAEEKFFSFLTSCLLSLVNLLISLSTHLLHSVSNGNYLHSVQCSPDGS